MKLSEELKWRGAIYDITNEELLKKLDTETISFYLGADATAKSLHIGNLASLMVVKLLESYGHKAYILIGGATTRIGDPKITSERDMMTEAEIDSNVKNLQKQAQNVVNCTLVNNYDWLKDYTFLDFLRDVGKYFNVAYMINKDIVKRRLESGISYTEFSYQLMQGYDFAYLNKNYGISLQVAGQDQWGNITSGVELVRKHPDYNGEVYGMTAPLILKSDGTKYGKSEEGAIWLDSNLTTVYDFYQYFISIPDDDALMFLKRFTLLPKEEIESIYEEFQKAPHQRLAQKTTAYEITKIVHGKDAADSAVRISEALFTSDLSKLTNDEIAQGFKDVYVCEVARTDKLLDVMIENGLAASKREGREFITNNAISINGEKITDVEATFENVKAINEKYLLLRRGKKKYYLLSIGG